VQRCPVIPDLSPAVIHWPFVATLLRLLLALAVGVFVGLEREHRAKAGARTPLTDGTLPPKRPLKAHVKNERLVRHVAPPRRAGRAPLSQSR
jgi:hypothetical protein